MSKFQSTLPRRERRHCNSQCSRFKRCFNPRSHEGSDVLSPNGVSKLGVSIHAPTKGATKEGVLRAKILTFQSTLPRRERLIAFMMSVASFGVSIHAPTKGATPLLSDSLCLPHCFNPRSHEGSDTYVGSPIPVHTLFQSTLPRRERLSRAATFPPIAGFNPRSHEGSDWKCGSKKRRYISFNPRSHEGSDMRRWMITAFWWSFNPRSHEGSDKN